MDGDKNQHERDFEEAVRQGIARMMERRKAEREVVELVGEDPETAAVGLIVLTRERREELRRELASRFGFVMDPQPGGGFVCRFASPGREPKTQEQWAQWLDAVVALAGLEAAQEAMFGAAAYFPWADQPRKVCDAFSDVMLEAPAAYNAFAASEVFSQPVREYAQVMAAAWARSHLRQRPGSKSGKALNSEGWAPELVNAASLAWAGFQEQPPKRNAPIKRGRRFRETLPRQRDGKLARSPGPDLINLIDRLFGGSEVSRPEQPPELELAAVADREALLKHARVAGLAPREMEVYRLFVENPGIKCREAAEQLGVSVGAVKKTKNRIKRRLSAA